MQLVVLQFGVKRRAVYTAIAVIWIVMPAYVITISVLGSDIVDGTCIAYGAYSSYAAEKAMISSGFMLTYLVPLLTMVFCYSRIVYTLRKKVPLVRNDCLKFGLILCLDAETRMVSLTDTTICIVCYLFALCICLIT